MKTRYASYFPLLSQNVFLFLTFSLIKLLKMFPKKSVSCQNAINHANIPLADNSPKPLEFPPPFSLETWERSEPTEATGETK